MSDKSASLPIQQKRSLLYAVAKRTFDVAVGGITIVVLSPVLLLVGLAVCMTSPGGAFYCQERVGRNNRRFKIYKFRTMVSNADQQGPQVTALDDRRITRIGRFLRNTKLDELPQFLNVLRGDMSLVGPRPQVPRFVEQFTPEYRDIILRVRPGITGPTQIAFRNEESMLEGREERERYYIEELLPVKCEMDAEYIRQSSFGYDMLVLARTARLFLRGNTLRFVKTLLLNGRQAAVMTRVPKETEEKAVS